MSLSQIKLIKTLFRVHDFLDEINLPTTHTEKKRVDRQFRVYQIFAEQERISLFFNFIKSFISWNRVEERKKSIEFRELNFNHAILVAGLNPHIVTATTPVYAYDAC